MYSRTCIKTKLLVPFSGTTTVCTTKNNQDINHIQTSDNLFTSEHIQNKGTLSLSPRPQPVHLLFEQHVFLHSSGSRDTPSRSGNGSNHSSSSLGWVLHR